MYMPLKEGTSQATVSKNISEIHEGPQYQKTKEKHGAEVAHKQAIAIALDKQRESTKKRENMSRVVKLGTGKSVTIRRR